MRNTLGKLEKVSLQFLWKSTDFHEDWWSWGSLRGRIIIIVSSYSSVSMTLWALRRGRVVRRMSSGWCCVGWAFGLAFAIRTMRSKMVMMMMTIFSFFFKDHSSFRAQAFDMISESCPVQSNTKLKLCLDLDFHLMIRIVVVSKWLCAPECFFANVARNRDSF